MRVRLFVVLATLFLSANLYSFDLHTLGSVGINEGIPFYVAIPVTYEDGCVTWTTTSVLRLVSGQTVFLINRFIEPSSILSKIESSNFPSELELAWQSAVDSELFYNIYERVLVSQPSKLENNLYSERVGYLLSVPEDVVTLHLYDAVSGKSIYAGPIFPVERDDVQF